MEGSVKTIILPETPLRYRFVSVHRIAGLSALPEGRDATLDLGAANVTATLTTDPTPALAAVERCAALGFLMLSAFQGREAGKDILGDAEKIHQERASERREKFPGAIYLVVQAHGEVTSSRTEAARDLEGAVLALDAVDKIAIRRLYDRLIEVAVTSVVLTLNATSDVVAVTDGVTFEMPDGRPLYSLSFRMGQARMTLSRVATTDDVQAFQRTAGALLNDARLQGPSRLFVDALRRSGDRLEAFIMGWAAIDMLLGKYTRNCENGQWLDRVPADQRALAVEIHGAFADSGHQFYSFVDRARVYALLFGGEDLSAELRRIKDNFREPLYHQGAVAEDALPVDTVIELLKKLMSVLVR
jgi:hypothetical protein